MTEQKTWKCTKTVITEDGSEAFTEGQLYKGLPYNQEVNAGTEKAYLRKAGWAFRNNQGNLHFGPFRWIKKYFEPARLALPCGCYVETTNAKFIIDSSECPKHTLFYIESTPGGYDITPSGETPPLAVMKDEDYRGGPDDE